MEKNIKVDEDLWKKIQQEKLDKKLKSCQEVIKIWRKKSEKKR